MLQVFRHRSTLLLRLLVLAVVALGTAGGALASALGELHEVSHAAHDVMAHDALTADAGHGDEELGARLLHALVHCGHCHGQGGVLPIAAAGWETLPILDAVRAGRVDAHWSPAHPENLLRPPIRG